MIQHGTVRGTQAVKPANIEINADTVYIRGSVVRKSETRDEETMEFWEYTEDVLSRTEYEAMQASAPNIGIADNAWDDGLQTMVRTILYERTDGDRAKLERKIRLGIDVDENTALLKKLDEYCDAVRATKDAEGYPTNVPSYPVYEN